LSFDPQKIKNWFQLELQTETLITPDNRAFKNYEATNVESLNIVDDFKELGKKERLRIYVAKMKGCHDQVENVYEAIVVYVSIGIPVRIVAWLGSKGNAKAR
jgi:hypothetical protein